MKTFFFNLDQHQLKICFIIYGIIYINFKISFIFVSIHS